MMAQTRWPLFGIAGEQIGWEIRVEDIESHGLLPVVPSDCPWYREHRLFRQKEPGAWDPVFEAIRAEVRRRVSHG